MFDADAMEMRDLFAYKQGAKDKEAEIIKLLEEELVFHEPVVINRHKLIALIKGEK